LIAQVAVGLALVLLALAAAALIQRRRPSRAPTQPAHWEVPAQLDRRDFARPDADWLVAVFTSASCATCAGVAAKARVLDCAAVAMEEVEVGARPEIHRRYHIEAVPLTVVADGEGVVRAAFAGPVTATDLWAAVAEVRQPGSSPEPHLGRDGIS
jgi:hypothetical protein